MRAGDPVARVLDALTRAKCKPNRMQHATCPLCAGRTLKVTHDGPNAKIACSKGCKQTDIVAALKLRPDDLLGVSNSAAGSAEPSVSPPVTSAGREKGDTVAVKLIEIGAELPLFADSAGRSYCLRSLPSGGARAVALGSSAYKNWLAGDYHRRSDGKKAASAEALQTALGVLTARACEKERAEVAVRVAEKDGSIYLDLADDYGRAVEMTSAGWSVVDRAPVPFRVAPGMLPLPAPERGGGLEELRPLLNAPGDDEWRLMVAWLIAALRPDKPFPILVLQGEQGSAKSTTGRLLRALIDPAKPADRGKPRDERSLAIAARNGWVLSYDNLSGLPDWLSDALSRIATGGGLAERQLHTDSDEVLFEAMRPIMANGIDEVATRPDLADRALRVALPVISEGARRELAEVWAEYEEIRPRALGALCDAVGGALRELPQTHLKMKPRMADFARWVTAAEPALRWTTGAIMGSYRDNRAELVEQSLEADSVAYMVRRLLEHSEGGAWTGTAGDLLDALTSLVAIQKAKDWPESPRMLSNRLHRVAPQLRAVGLTIDGPTSTGHDKRRLYRLQSTGGEVPHVRVSNAIRVAPADLEAFIARGPSRGPGAT
jgi:hypothetical protein